MDNDCELLQPYWWTGGETGCLLVHGFTSSPLDLRPLARHLHGRGFTVYCPVLPGHCTTPEDMARYGWQDWLNAVEQALSTLEQFCPRCWLVGFSMGGVLANIVAARRPVAGVVSIAAPVWVRARLARFAFLLQPFARYVQLARRPQFEEPSFRYQYVALKNVADLMRLIGEAKVKLAQISVPVLVVQGEDDRTIYPASARYIYDKLGSRDKELVFTRGGHMLLLGENRHDVCQRIGEFISTRIGGKKDGYCKTG